MSTFRILKVSIRPHGESIALDGQTFTNPIELWNYLHRRAALEAGSPRSVRNSVFVTESALRHAIAVTKCPDAIAYGADGRTRFQDLLHRASQQPTAIGEAFAKAKKGKVPVPSGLSLADLDLDV